MPLKKHPRTPQPLPQKGLSQFCLQDLRTLKNKVRTLKPRLQKGLILLKGKKVRTRKSKSNSFHRTTKTSKSQSPQEFWASMIQIKTAQKQRPNCRKAKGFKLREGKFCD